MIYAILAFLIVSTLIGVVLAIIVPIIKWSCILLYHLWKRFFGSPHNELGDI